MEQSAQVEKILTSEEVKNQPLESETPEEEQEPPMCHWCNGTGENRWGTGACRDCRGLGVERPKRR